MTATVLIGPRTRLGREVLRRTKGTDVLALARHAEDAALVSALPELGAAAVADGSSTDLRACVAGLGTGPVRVVVAALGPVHPETPRAAVDAPAVLRDLAFVEQVLDAGRPVRVVLVSTVLALAPGEDRRYYGGWKAVVEQQLQQLVDDRTAAGGDASLSVVYPGRLLDAAERKGRLKLHTSYSTLARIVLTKLDGAPSGRPVGIDSRFWLLVNSISLALRSLTPSTRRSIPPPPSIGVNGPGHSGESG
ncbi:hypothetical protein ASE01_05790 [Nocardioides sp. Root190]|uniref:hypothetical protein n=1 Tax=Nocardioides sp. Root190 TaxID=1736488 RepID=UPI0006F7272A|nr:hypothetical protein [Nocardioides sp. Root190]KRB77713.1 hypothetical protein ASE01_05790 [Nocardioides sp. Root190]